MIAVGVGVLSISLLICYEFRCLRWYPASFFENVSIGDRATVMSSSSSIVTFTVASSFHQFSVSQNASSLIFIAVPLAACVWDDSSLLLQRRALTL